MSGAAFFAVDLEAGSFYNYVDGGIFFIESYVPIVTEGLFADFFDVAGDPDGLQIGGSKCAGLNGVNPFPETDKLPSAPIKSDGDLMGIH